MATDERPAADRRLDGVIATLARRFPAYDADAITAVVCEVFEQLRTEATVDDHLIALTQNRAAHRIDAPDDADARG